MKMKVAFGMENDHELFDGHYGDSNFFAIYEITPSGEVKIIEKRENFARDMDENEHGDVNKFRAVMAYLQDVDLLAAYRMGPNFLRIKENTSKEVFFTKTKNFNRAMKNLLQYLKDRRYIKEDIERINFSDTMSCPSD